MRIVFMGTPEFARRPLKKLYDDGFEIAGVFTQADKPQNRGMKVCFSPVKEFAIEQKIPVFQPTTLRDGTAVKILSELYCDLIVVVAYGKMLPKEILDIPAFGCVNIHASLLPKYRGAAPIQHAILNGEFETGVTSMMMAEEMDAGDVLFTEKVIIGNDETAAELTDRLSRAGAGLLCETVKAISNGTAVRTPQDHNKATFAPLLKKEMSPIDWAQPAAAIKNKVRGLIPWPVATMELGGKPVKVFSVETTGEITDKPPGAIVSTRGCGLEVACADGTVIINELQAPGGKRMTATDYLRGNPV